MNKVKKYLLLLLMSFAIVVAICCMLVIATRATGLKNYVKFFSVVSGSMEPNLKLGSVVLVRSEDKYKIGDIVSYVSTDGVVVTHRIVSEKVLENGDVIFETKGDANDNKDSKTVPKDAIIGKVTINIPLLGYVTSFLQTQVGVIVLVIIPTAIFITLESINIFRGIRKYKKLSATKTLILTILMFAFVHATLQKSYSHISVERLVKAKFESTTWQDLKLYFNQEKNSVGFEITNISEFDQIFYKITYQALTPDGVIDHQIEGGIANMEQDQEITEQWILLGFCSSGGTCVYDNLVNSVSIEVKLVQSGNIINTLSKTI